MEVFVKNFEGVVSSIDSSVGDVLQNKYFFIISVVLVLLLGSLNSTMINKRIFYLYDGALTRLALMGLIYYVSTKNVPLAILLLSSILVSMNTYNKYKFNLLLMSHINNNNFNDKMFHKLIRKMRRFKKMIRSSKKSRRGSKRYGSNKSLSSSIKIIKKNKKLDRLRRKSVKKIFDSIKVILNSLKSSNKVPSKLTKLALKAKNIATSLGKKTPKIVKEVAQKIKNIAVSKGISTPKIVSRLSTTVGLSNLLKKSKKISSRLVKKIVNRTNNPFKFTPVSSTPSVGSPISSVRSPTISSVSVSPSVGSPVSSVKSPTISSVSVSPSVGSPASSVRSPTISSVSISPKSK